MLRSPLFRSPYLVFISVVVVNGINGPKCENKHTYKKKKSSKGIYNKMNQSVKSPVIV